MELIKEINNEIRNVKFFNLGDNGKAKNSMSMNLLKPCNTRILKISVWTSEVFNKDREIVKITYTKKEWYYGVIAGEYTTDLSAVKYRSTIKTA